MITTAKAWSEAGGSGPSFTLYSQIGTARGFADATGRCLATIHPALPHVGAVGDWVGGDGPRLAAEAWLASQGCTVLRAPMELCSYFPYRASLGPYDQPPFFSEPSDRADRWADCGYHVAMRYHSDQGTDDGQGIVDAGIAVDAKLREQGWDLELWGTGGVGSIDPETFRDGVSLVHRLSEICFREAYGFASIPEAALQAAYAPLRPFVDPRIVTFARAPDSEIGGFFFGVPDHSRPGRFLLKSMAVLPKHRRKGLAAWMSGELYRSGRLHGYDAGIHAMIAETSHSRHVSAHGGTCIRRYALFEKST